MNRNRKEELLTRWMDGELDPKELHELAPLLARHPELEREREEYARIRAGLQEAVPADVEPPYPDFFNSHLECKAREMVRGAATRGGARRRWRQLWGWWLAPAGIAAVVMAFLVGMKVGRPELAGPPPPVGPPPPALYSPMSEVRAEAHIDDELDATVIVLSGLADLADRELSGVGKVVRGAGGAFINASQPRGL